MERHPLAQADADRRDLVLRDRPVKTARLVRPLDPDPDAIFPLEAAQVEARERGDDPGFERGDEGAHIGPAPLQVEHDIGHPLARPMIGELPAPPCAMHRKARVDEILVPGRCAGGVERRMLDQPDEFVGLTGRNGGGPRLHEGDGGLVGHQPRLDVPAHGRGTRRRQKRNVDGLSLGHGSPLT